MATSTLGSGTLVLAGTTSGTTTVTATAVAGTTTLTLPAATDTLVGKATTDTLTNKTLTGAAMNGTVGATTPAAGAFTTLSATGVTTVQAGSAASPAITTTGDTNTGIFFPAADTIAFSEGGVEAARFDSSGNVGIGTASPSTRLDVRQSTAADLQLQLYNNNAGVYATTIKLNADNATGSYYNAIQSYNSATAQWQIGGGGSSSTIVFGTGSSLTERMRIDSSGNVGIGTSSPSAKLQADSSSTTYSANIRARNSNFGNGVIGAASGILTVATDMNNIAFYTGSNLGVDGTSVPTNERMRIDSSGNVLVTNVAGLGYGTGSGGTVTQATSKSTAVTLNKPTGVITMNNAALASNTTVAFGCTNSMAAAIDTVVLTPLTSTIDMSFYSWGAAMNGAGNIQIYLRNISGGSRSEAVVFNFAIIKGATS